MLESIHSPADIRGLGHDQLELLAAEIREFLVHHISTTGGHLSPNLGVVELTLALHRVFQSPDEAIVWDTGHQAYVHKLLTGRANAFSTLRQPGGLSGYPNRAESPHDLVENSHASTSLSYALGLAEARLRDQVPGHVVAVIGDGALTGGMAYEALNQIAHLRPPNLIIVINDNGRSYAPTVGGLARHLAQLQIDPRYERLKEEISHRLRELPLLGAQAEEAAFRFKESLKQLLQPTTVFDSLGLKYVGPCDGHDLPALEDLLRRAKRLGVPTVVHVVTEKGRGYGPAIDDAVDKLHQVSAQTDPLTGRPRKTELTYTDVFAEAVLSAGARHPDVVAITAAMASSTGLLGFAREFPDRFFDVGICEQHAVTFAAGLAMAGKRPIVCIYSTFLQRAFDQTIMDVCLHRLPVVFVLDRAGVTGNDGPSHHGVFDLSYLRLIPNLRIAAPADATELCALLETALAMDGPVAIRFPKGTVPSTPDLPVEPLPVGRWEEVRRGEEVCILAIGRMVEVACVAADRLAAEGITCGVVNARWLKPIDPRLVTDWAPRYRVLVTAEDNVGTGGFGSAVLEALAPHGLADRVRISALPDRFLPHGRPAEILAEHGLDPEGLVRAVRAALDRHHHPARSRPAAAGPGADEPLRP
ncbi:MAG TPA: 1-deoxy-D-xylulose-5-phosphate synthase [Candidatus Dormibacteraeota bacterium]|nr:1-deoxy-D-xylulose-5-phosphate synthase [Candidatus Dormibacteraeota bacterium]